MDGFPEYFYYPSYGIPVDPTCIAGDLERGLAQHEPLIPGLSRPMSLPVRGSVLLPSLGTIKSQHLAVFPVLDDQRRIEGKSETRPLALHRPALRSRRGIHATLAEALFAVLA
jgi:hypothetical protein